MKKNKYLTVTSVLEIIAGLASILLIRFLLVKGDTIVILSKEVETTALWGLVLIYGVNIFKILAGIIGLCFAHKKSIITVICGIILVLAHGSNAFVGEISILALTLDIIPLLIPAYYLYGAVQNYKTTPSKKAN